MGKHMLASLIAQGVPLGFAEKFTCPQYTRFREKN